MKIYKQYFVAKKADSNLAYVLPLTGGEKKIEQIKEKGIRWATEKVYDNVKRQWVNVKEGEYFTLDNTPTKGYKVIGFSTRYSTSNKHIYIEHPNGFVFEMTIETFIEMLKEVKIENGIIQDEMIIYSMKGKNALCVNGGELFDSLEDDGAKFINVSNLSVGDVIVLRGKSTLQNKITYLGEYNIVGVGELSWNDAEAKEALRGENVYGCYGECDTFYTFNIPNKVVYVIKIENGENISFQGYSDTKRIRVAKVISNDCCTNVKNEINKFIGDSSYNFNYVYNDSSLVYSRSEKENALKGVYGDISKAHCSLQYLPQMNIKSFYVHKL